MSDVSNSFVTRASGTRTLDRIRLAYLLQRFIIKIDTTRGRDDRFALRNLYNKIVVLFLLLSFFFSLGFEKKERLTVWLDAIITLWPSSGIIVFSRGRIVLRRAFSKWCYRLSKKVPFQIDFIMNGSQSCHGVMLRCKRYVYGRTYRLIGDDI